jgi:hypothetical protein
MAVYRTILAATKCLAFVLFVLAIGASAVAVINFSRHADEKSRQTDMAIFYAAGTMAARGDFADLYDVTAMRIEQRRIDADRVKPQPFPYPALFATAFAPFSLVPYSAAYTLFFALNLSPSRSSLCCSGRSLLQRRPPYVGPFLSSWQ